jgi:hypothetical protein
MMTDMMKTLRESLPSANDVLHQVGFEHEHPAPSVLTAVATFTLGAITGAAFALLFTPRTGRAMRQTLRDRLHTSRERVAAPTNGDGYELASSSGAATHLPKGVATTPG